MATFLQWMQFWNHNKGRSSKAQDQAAQCKKQQSSNQMWALSKRILLAIPFELPYETTHCVQTLQVLDLRKGLFIPSWEEAAREDPQPGERKTLLLLTVQLQICWQLTFEEAHRVKTPKDQTQMWQVWQGIPSKEWSAQTWDIQTQPFTDRSRRPKFNEKDTSGIQVWKLWKGISH